MRRFFSAALAAAALLAVAPAAEAADFGRTSVSPARAFVLSREPVRISFQLSGAVPADVVVRLVGAGGEVRRFDLPQAAPGRVHEIEWAGLQADGDPVPDGTYRVMIGSPGSPEREAGAVEVLGHFYPVRGRHGIRGAVGVFHAPRNGGRIHEGFDVTASCGTPLAAVRAGRVVRRGYDSRLYGNFIQIRGVGERTTYFYAHMAKPSPYKRGDRVLTGATVGRIGLTGNAAGTPCHLHIQIEERGRLVDPYPLLRRWDKTS